MIFTHHFADMDSLRECICLPNCFWRRLMAQNQLILAREFEICQMKRGQDILLEIQLIRAFRSSRSLITSGENGLARGNSLQDNCNSLFNLNISHIFSGEYPLPRNNL